MRLIDVDKLNRKDVNCANVPMNFIDTAPIIEAYTKDEIIAMLKKLQQAILVHQRFQSSTTLTRVVKTTDIEIEIEKALDKLRGERA